MGRFRIQSHARLQEWVAEEKGYFKDEGLDYEFIVKPIAAWSDVQSTESAPQELRAGAFESFEEGRACDLSAACHWTVNMAASAGHGRMWGRAYSVTPSGIYVPPESPIKKPEDLANVPVTAGYHSGSHFSTLQNLERFLKREEIKLHFAGLLLDRLVLLVDRKVAAASLFGAPLYVAEQLGFRKIVDTSFMIGHLITGDANEEEVERYFRALRRAQRDIDIEPELYKHYFLRELPERFQRMVDIRMFGPGERLVFEPYPKEVFERTRRWIESWNLFPPEQTGNAGYESSVVQEHPLPET
ncbi:MAG: ABC transporter substrate-binding protein [Deltaproteobacteria bacterium]|nr:MAG: ABC transporter substrate-binding protein [Deltaproteobacteria bacterium]